MKHLFLILSLAFLGLAILDFTDFVDLENWIVYLGFCIVSTYLNIRFRYLGKKEEIVNVSDVETFSPVYSVRRPIRGGGSTPR